MCEGHRLEKTKEKNRAQFQTIPPVTVLNSDIHLGPSGFPELELLISNCLLDFLQTALKPQLSIFPLKLALFIMIPASEFKEAEDKWGCDGGCGRTRNT